MLVLPTSCSTFLRNISWHNSTCLLFASLTFISPSTSCITFDTVPSLMSAFNCFAICIAFSSLTSCPLLVCQCSLSCSSTTPVCSTTKSANLLHHQTLFLKYSPLSVLWLPNEYKSNPILFSPC